MSDAFAHIVSIDKLSRKLTIERLFPDGRREFLTETEVPNIALDGAQETLKQFAQDLGENLLLDSPSARELLDL